MWNSVTLICTEQIWWIWWETALVTGCVRKHLVWFCLMCSQWVNHFRVAMFFPTISSKGSSSFTYQDLPGRKVMSAQSDISDILLVILKLLQFYAKYNNITLSNGLLCPISTFTFESTLYFILEWRNFNLLLQGELLVLKSTYSTTYLLTVGNCVPACHLFSVLFESLFISINTQHELQMIHSNVKYEI